MSYLDLDILTIHKMLENKEITSTMLVNECFDNIMKNIDLNALNETMKDYALSRAKEIDEKYMSGEKLPLLAGIPVVIKDNINMLNTKTTCSSKILSNYESIYDATVVKKLKDFFIQLK